MSLPVGIHQNVKFSASKNDQGSLVIKAEVVDANQDNFDLNAVTLDNPGEQSQNFLFYPFKTEGYEGGRLVDKRSAPLIATDIKDAKAVLTFLLTLVMPEDEIEWNLYEGTDITVDNQKTELFGSDTNLKAVYDNLVNQFITQFNAGDTDQLFRTVFVRTSGPKHYPKLRTRELDKFPFAEPMTVEEEDSKVKFTPYELKAKLDNPDPVTPNQSAADKDTSSLDL